ncbi:beta-ketoacyl-ACP synthase III [Jatrophihabitans sp.]|uniref:beta-ketoacyl-ACP synthase III n=1 Tax=Jatrophihabitans sp. TaxID=1932789 RepID=UPI002CB32A80|nr:beta-ketoacyl-ACP synthase III [Jatrophihabitans sp.]
MNLQLSTPPRPAGSRVAGLGHYQPPTVVTNDDLVARGVHTSDEWIQTRVGIAERRFATDETMLDMAVAAASKALANSGISPTEIDLVILATCTGKQQVPGGAAELASRLGIPSPGAYDLNAACAGFVYGLNAASNAVLAGHAHTVLVVGSEKLTDYVDLMERGTGIIFADGAGAAVVTASDRAGIGPVVWGSDGDSAGAITTDPATATLRQEGQSVFRWATSTMGDVALRACAAAGLEPSQLAGFIPHQANLRIIDLIAKKLNAPNVVVARDIITSGNTSSASIPIALSKMLERGEITSGAPVLVVGFGAGLTYAAQVILAP